MTRTDSSSVPMSDDDCEDQALVATKVCTNFRCQTWVDRDQVKPTLVKLGKYWCCPKCGGSYGEHPH